MAHMVRANCGKLFWSRPVPYQNLPTTLHKLLTVLEVVVLIRAEDIMVP